MNPVALWAAAVLVHAPSVATWHRKNSSAKGYLRYPHAGLRDADVASDCSFYSNAWDASRTGVSLKMAESRLRGRR